MLRKILNALEEEGMVVKQPGGGYAMPDALPSVAVLEVCAITLDGDILARPVNWNADERRAPPRIEIAPDPKYSKNIREKQPHFMPPVAH